MIDCSGNELLPEDRVVVHTSDGLRFGYVSEANEQICKVMVVDRDITCRFYVNSNHIARV